MTSDTRAFVALVSGRLVAQRGVESIFDRDREREFDLAGAAGYKFRPTGKGRSCGVARDTEGESYCLFDGEEGQHICLSLYGRLFEGFDHATSSHFNGFVDGPLVSHYDFSESDYFSYRLLD